MQHVFATKHSSSSGHAAFQVCSSHTQPEVPLLHSAEGSHLFLLGLIYLED